MTWIACLNMKIKLKRCHRNLTGDLWEQRTMCSINYTFKKTRSYRLYFREDGQLKTQKNILHAPTTENVIPQIRKYWYTTNIFFLLRAYEMNRRGMVQPRVLRVAWAEIEDVLHKKQDIGWINRAEFVHITVYHQYSNETRTNNS